MPAEEKSEGFYCPSAIAQGGGPDSPFKPPFDGKAEWQDRGDGARTCSFCGSIHPDDFTDIMKRYADGEEGYTFDTTTKSYKLYGSRPGVRNASEGGIKFYGDHLQGIDRTEFDRQCRRAKERLSEKWKARGWS